MKFTKTFLQMIVDEENKSSHIVENTVINILDCAKHHKIIFKFVGNYYETFYDVGTNGFDELPFEYDDDIIDCDEVFPIEKTVIVYEKR